MSLQALPVGKCVIAQVTLEWFLLVVLRVDGQNVFIQGVFPDVRFSTVQALELFIIETVPMLNPDVLMAVPKSGH